MAVLAREADRQNKQVAGLRVDLSAGLDPALGKALGWIPRIWEGPQTVMGLGAGDSGLQDLRPFIDRKVSLKHLDQLPGLVGTTETPVHTSPEVRSSEIRTLRQLSHWSTLHHSGQIKAGK